jgi:hypothetical protein
MSDQSDPVAAEDFPILRKYSTPPGWIIDVYAAITDAGVVITRLDIRTDPAVEPINGVTATVLDNVKLPAFRAEISALLDKLNKGRESVGDEPEPNTPGLRLLAQRASMVEKQAAAENSISPRRTSLKKQRDWTGQAEQALAAAHEAIEEKASLSSILEEMWDMDREGVRSRLRRLRERNYIKGTGRSIQAGPALELWRQRQIDSQEEK